MPSKEQAQSSSKSTAKQKAPQPAIPETDTLAQLELGALVQRASTDQGALTPRDVLQLQRTMGNRSAQRLLTRVKPQAPTRSVIQTKLTVGPAGDRYEQEADQVAQQVMRQIDTRQSQIPDLIPSPETGVIQRFKMDPPNEMAGMKLGEITEVVQEFGEGKATFLVRARGKEYVLKLSSENPRAEVITAQFGRMLNVPMPAAIYIEYDRKDLDDLPTALQSGKIKKKLEKNLSEIEPDVEKGWVVLTEFVQGTSLNKSMGVEEGVPIEEGQSNVLKQRLQETGKLTDFFITLGKIAAFDLIVGHTDRFSFEDVGYRGNRALGNLGNFMIGQDSGLVAIDLDLGEPSLEDKSVVGSLGEKFAPHINALKSNKVEAIIKMVLLSVSEGDDTEKLNGELANISEAPELVRHGIDQVLAQVKALKGEDLSEIRNAWAGISDAYGEHLLGTLKELGAGQQ